MAFTVGIVSVITGIIFTVIVTRRLSPEELGLWTLIGSLVSYVVIAEPIISYWASRQIARGKKVGRTALATSTIFSTAATGVYFIAAILVSLQIKADLFPILLAAALVPITFINNTLSGISLGHKPHATSFSIVAYEISKLPLGFLLVYIVNLGVAGAIVATVVASIIRMIVLLAMNREQLVHKITKEFTKLWLRLSWIPLYSSGTGFIFTLDVLVYSILTNSLIGLAFWGVANAVANVVNHSGQISQALYPKLLATEKKEFAEENLKKLFFFAIPILAAAIVFAKPALHILNPIYIDGVFIVYLLSFRSLAYILLNFFFNIIGAYEKIDIDKGATFKMYIKSKLFFLPTLNYVMSISYVGTLGIFLSMFKETANETELVNIWSTILLIVTLPFTIYGIIQVKRKLGIGLPYRVIIKYSTIAFFTSLFILFILENFLTYTRSIYDFLPQVIPIILIGGMIYFGIAYLFDKSTREFLKSIINEMKHKQT